MDRKLKADLALMFCSLIWGVTFVVVKTGLDHSSPFVFLAVRFSIAAVLMALFRPHVLGRIQRGEIFPGMRLAFFMFSGYCFQTAGLQYTTATNSGFVTGSSVVLVPLLLAIFWGRTLTKWIYAGAFAALIGLYFLTVPAEGLRYLNRGDVLTFIAAGFYAVHIILVGEYSQEHSVSALSLIQVAGCAVMAWPLTGFAGRHSLATGAFRLGLAAFSGDPDLRGVCHRRGLHGAIVGATVHFSGTRGDSFCAGAGICGDYVLRFAARAPKCAGVEGRRPGRRRDSYRRIVRGASRAGSARTHLRRPRLL